MKSKVKPIKIDPSILEIYVGSYDFQQLYLVNGEIFIQREDEERMQLKALEMDLFALTDDPRIRIRFIKESNKVVALKALFADGNTEMSLIN